MKKIFYTLAVGGMLIIFSFLFVNLSRANNSSQLELIKNIDNKINDLTKLMKIAKLKGYDVEREKATVFMANQFLKFAKYDESHVKINTTIFDKSYVYKKKNRHNLAKNLPKFERTEVLKMLTSSIHTLNDVINKRILRKPVNRVEWKNIHIKNGQFYNSNNKPVFLYDYFSKAHGLEDKNPNVYNDYVGDLANPLSLSLNLLKPNYGKLNSLRMNKIINFDKNFPEKSGNIGYITLWKGWGALPKWLARKYGEKNLTHGITRFTGYDIDNPHIRKAWKRVLNQIVPQLKNKNFTKLSYILSNEPHWYVDNKSWFVIKNGISNETLTKFRTWLKIKHHGSITELNNLWKTSYNNFTDVTIKIPFDVKKIRGSAKFYDWSRFNMARVTDWFKFLHDNIKRNDPQANTSIKIMPRIFVSDKGSRDHGINPEKLTNITEFAGNDMTIRKENFGTKHESWQENYAYYWREVAMSSDLLSSFSPNKIIFNSESHFISTSHFRDLHMKPKYVRSAYWLSTILGTNANNTWYWARYGDGSIEKRIITGNNNGGVINGYPGSVVQMPRVANEIIQTMLDLNAHSSDIIKFQRQEKPIRLFYSETSNINYKNQINKLFNIYKAMYFNGIPIGFATQNILDNHIGKFNEVIIYNTPTVTNKEFNAIQTYLNNGGTVITDHQSLKLNEYKQARNKILVQSSGKLIVVNNDNINNNNNINEIQHIKNIAFKILPKDKQPTIKIQETNGTKTKGSIWRVVNGTNKNNKIVTIVNVGKTTAHLKIFTNNFDNNKINIVNMLTGQKLNQHTDLESEKVLFLKVSHMVN